MSQVVRTLLLLSSSSSSSSREMSQITDRANNDTDAAAAAPFKCCTMGHSQQIKTNNKLNKRKLFCTLLIDFLLIELN